MAAPLIEHDPAARARRVRLVDVNGDPVSVGGGTQYTDGDTQASPVGTVALWKAATNVLRAVSSSNPLPVNVVAGGAGDGAILDGVTSSIKASVLNYTNSKPLAVRLTDTNGDYVTAGGGTEYTDKQAFTEGTSGGIKPAGAVFNDTITGDPAEDQITPLRITAKKGLHVNLRTASGTEIGTAGAPMRVDPTGSTTQPISGTVTANQGGTWTVQPGNTANTTAWLVTGTGGTFPVTGTFWQATQPVSLASVPSHDVTNAGTFAVQAAQSGTWNITNVSGTVSLPTGAATSANQSTEITSLQLIDDVPHAMNAAFVKAAAIAGQLDDTATTAATEDNVAPLRITAQRAAHVNLRNVSGTEVGTSGAPLRIDPTGSTAQPVTGTFWQSTQPVSIATMPSTPVTGTFWQATQPVSGTVTANIGTTNGLALDATLTGGTQQSKLTDGTNVATVRSLTNSKGLNVAIVDANGDQITSFGGGTQYADGAARGTATGTLMMVDDGTNIQSAQGTTAGVLKVDLSATTANATAVKVDGSAVTQPVSGTFWQTTQPVSIAATVTVDSELPAAAALADGASATPSTPTVGAVPLLMNASTVDRARAIINATNSTGTGIIAAGLVAQLDDTSPTTITENQFGNVRMSSRRALLVEGPPSAVATQFLPVRLADGTNYLDTATLFDLDTGAGTQYVAGTTLRRGASGGSVEAGIPAYPIAIEKVDSTKTTYSAVAVGIAPAATATDVFTITGSASKTVRVLRIGISGTQTTAGLVNVILAKRSAANTGGTSASATVVPHDSNNAAGTATVLSYTANPTTGTLVGNVRAGLVEIGGTASVAPQEMQVFDFGNEPGQCIVLRGTAQVLAVNLNSVTVTGGSLTYWVEWSEET